MIVPVDKIKAILLYISNNTNTKYLGKIKLMKLFYFLDFEYVKNYGIPVTFDTYYHLEKGPIPSYIMNLVNDINDDGQNEMLIDTVKFCKPPGTKRMVQTLPVRQFTKKDEEILLESELKILKDVCKRFYNTKTDEIVEISHKEAPWLETKDFQPIPYSLAGKMKNSKFTEEEIKISVNITS
ncbi:MAG: hypothetical protein UR54_C0004G0016 [Candidatus Roizmanbacteria bacterium GW2011_GWA2_34_18]|uniref:Antitoxin SocA-like Panacea domain-containing protein n=1 Tax=Candidatus Roizmanbacteria bacterium GW2011_GWA2_34_18 TaxID=1618477 RepID=A0A0G0E1J5_9BACT|nr:MAG: hypothetical protein UR54_C0004G0016 [Candidatus Roizmanbacteria bacterium GW2011_GWA2_34_18]